MYGSITKEMNSAYAEYVAVKENFVHPLPDMLSFSHSAAIPVPYYFTAYRALFHRVKAQPGETFWFMEQAEEWVWQSFNLLVGWGYM